MTTLNNTANSNTKRNTASNSNARSNAAEGNIVESTIAKGNTVGSTLARSNIAVSSTVGKGTSTGQQQAARQGQRFNVQRGGVQTGGRNDQFGKGQIPSAANARGSLTGSQRA